jgi:polyisoprenoid-binding protein YceI
MRTNRFVFGIFSLSALLAVAGCANPAEDTTPAKVSDHEVVAEETTDVLPAGDVYSIAEGSTIEFTGSKITGSHNGGFNTFGGDIVLVDGDPTASRLEITIETASLWADAEKLTVHLKSAEFFGIEEFPTARFTSTAITSTDGGYEITGNLDLHGVTKQIAFPAGIEVGDGVIAATAEFHILRNDFDIVYPGRPNDLIRDEVVIRLNITARPPA